MDTVKHPSATHCLSKPREWDDEKDGKCGDLWVHADYEACQLSSYWKPTAEELELLAKGGLVRLVVVGAGHPPVAIDVQPPVPVGIQG